MRRERERGEGREDSTVRPAIGSFGPASPAGSSAGSGGGSAAAVSPYGQTQSQFSAPSLRKKTRENAYSAPSESRKWQRSRPNARPRPA